MHIYVLNIIIFVKEFFMDRKLLFFDIDGTLLAGGVLGYIPESAILGLRQAQANGHYLFINSGRTYSFMPKAIKEFPFDGYVCGCGTEVIFQGKTLFHNELPREVRLGLKDILRNNRMQGVFEGRSACFFDDSSTLISPIKSIRDTYISAQAPDAVRTFEDPEMDFDKFVVFSDANSDFDNFLSEISEYFTCVQREPMGEYHFNEFIPKNCSKATGIDFIVNYMDASLDNCYVFGDSSNDLSMLRHVKNSVAMGNAVPEVLGQTSYVTTPVDRDGIYVALKHFHLI